MSRFPTDGPAHSFRHAQPWRALSRRGSSAALAVLFVLALLLAPIPAGAAPDGDGDNGKAADPPQLWDGKEKRREVGKALKGYFKATDAQRAEYQALLEKIGAIKPSQARRYQRDALKLIKKTPTTRLTVGNQKFTHEKLTGAIYMSGTPGRGKPLLIALHGGGKGVGDGRNAMRKWSGFARNGVVIAPTAPELRGTAWNSADIERYVLALITAAQSTWQLDTNRTYLAGHSMGGFGTWSIGCRNADRFAAISPCAGGVFANPGNTETGGIASGHIPNLLNTPIWFYHSTDDRQVPAKNDQIANKYLQKLKDQGYPYVWVYKEYTNRGHGLPPGGMREIIAWLVTKKRKPYPKHIVWEPSRAHKRLFNWVEVQSSTARFGRAGRLEAKIVKNTIELKTSGNLGAITVYLNDKLVKLNEPVTITKNGTQVFQGLVYPRLSVLMHTLATTRDPEQFYTAAVTVR